MMLLGCLRLSALLLSLSMTLLATCSPAGSRTQVSNLLSEPVAPQQSSAPLPKPTADFDVILEKSLEITGIGTISSLTVYPDPETKEPRLLAIGRRGCAWLSLPELALVREVPFLQAGPAFGPDRPQSAVDVDGDGVPEAMEKPGDYDLPSINVRSTRTGETIWSFQPHSPIILLAPLRKRGGGMSITIGCRRSATPGEGFDNHVQILDEKGKVVDRQRWAERDGAFIEHQFCVVDHDGDGADELLYGNAGELILRDSAGSVIWRDRPVPQSSWTQAIFPLDASMSNNRATNAFLLRVTASRLFRGNYPAFKLTLIHEDNRTAGLWKDLTDVEIDALFRAGIGHVVPLPSGEGSAVIQAGYRRYQGDVFTVRLSTLDGQALLDKVFDLKRESFLIDCPSVWSADHGAGWFAWGKRVHMMRLVVKPDSDQPKEE